MIAPDNSINNKTSLRIKSGRILFGNYRAEHQAYKRKQGLAFTVYKLYGSLLNVIKVKKYVRVFVVKGLQSPL